MRITEWKERRRPYDYEKSEGCGRAEEKTAGGIHEKKRKSERQLLSGNDEEKEESFQKKGKEDQEKSRSAEAEKIRYRCLFLREMERDRKSVFIQKEDQKRH